MTEDIKTPAKGRTIFVSGDFDEKQAKEVINKLFELENENPLKDIMMFIDSYGGACDSFIAIHDIMKIIRCDIATVCIGKAMSCGQMLLISGTKGKRFITKNSRVLIHEISNFTCGKLTDIEIDINETKELKKIVENLIVKYTKIKEKDLKLIMQRDSYFSAEESLKLGIVDYIISGPKDLYSRIKI